MGEISFSIPMLQDHPFWGTQGHAASRACCSPAFKPHWIHMLPIIRVIFPLVSAWLWLVAISSIQPWPYALGYQQEQERKDYNLQGTVSTITQLPPQQDRAGEFPVLLLRLYSSVTWHFALRFVMHLPGWKSYFESLNPPVLSPVICFIEKCLEGLFCCKNTVINLGFKAVRI